MVVENLMRKSQGLDIPPIEGFNEFKELVLLMYYNDKELSGENEFLPLDKISKETNLSRQNICRANKKLEEHIHIMKQSNRICDKKSDPNSYYSISRLDYRTNPELFDLDIKILEFMYTIFCLDKNDNGMIEKSDLQKYYSRPTISKYIKHPELQKWIHISSEGGFHGIYYKKQMFKFLDTLEQAQKWKDVDQKYSNQNLQKCIESNQEII